MTEKVDPPEHDSCEDCALAQPRRDFLKQAGLSVLGALALVGIPAELAAMMQPTLLAADELIDSDPSYPIPAKDGVQIDRKQQVILVRWQNAVFAFNLSCPHQNTALHWNEKDAEFQCPKHHSRYHADGTFIAGRATRNMDRFSISRQGSSVIVHVNQMHKNDADKAGWAQSVVSLVAGA